MIGEATMLDLMWRQSLLLSLGCLLLLGLRSLLLKRVGAPAAYASWLLIPLLLLTTTLPRPAQEPLRVVLQQGALPGLAKAATTAPATSDLNRQALFALWAAGALGVALTQWHRQRRFEALISKQDGRLPAASSPALLGLWRARLALPQDFEQRFDGDEQQLILAHEAVHRRRHDNGWNLLACALCALHWFNPLAWIAWRRMRADQELSCDAAVLRAHPQQTAVYARALAKTAPMTSPFAVTASTWHSRHHPLVERVAMLKAHATASPGRRRLAACFVSIGIALCGGVAYAVQGEKTAGPESAQVQLDMNVSWRDGNVRKATRVILRGHFGEPLRVAVGRDPAKPDDAGNLTPVEFTVTVTDLGNEQLMLDTVLRSGTPLRELARPRMQVSNGGPARLVQDDRAAGRLLELDIKTSILPIKPPQ